MLRGSKELGGVVGVAGSQLLLGERREGGDFAVAGAGERGFEDLDATLVLVGAA